MASSAKDIQLRELMDTVSQLKTMMAEQTELIRAAGTGGLSDEEAFRHLQ